MEFGTETKWILGITVFLVSGEFMRQRSRGLLFTSGCAENLIWLALNKGFSFAFLGTLIYGIQRFVNASLPFRIDLTAVSVWLQLSAFLLAADIVSYFAHRLLHVNPWLWRFHKLHHSSTDLMTTSAFRHHTFEELWYAAALGIFTAPLAVSNEVKLTVYIMITAACYFQHAHLELPIPYWVNHFLITPLNHSWHHSTEMVKVKGQNFGLFFPFWDKAFGTHHVPASPPETLGIKSPYPSSLWRRWFHPFLSDS